MSESAPRTLTESAREVAARHGLTLEDIKGRSKRRKCVHARWEVMWTLDRRGLTSTRIGMFLKRNHATVLHGLKRHAEISDGKRRGALHE